MIGADEHSFFAGLPELFEGAGVPLLLSLAATGVRFLRFGWRGWRHFFSSITTSILLGQTVFWGMDYYPDINFTVKAAATLAAAYGGSRILDAVLKRISREVRECHMPPRGH